MKQKLILRKKKNGKSEIKSSLKGKEKLVSYVLSKELEVIKLKEYAVMALFIVSAALLRVPMQAFPSVEPITFFALIAGWLFGKKKGFITGAGSLYLSNFLVFGGQGIWTLFQALGFGIAGFLGGFLRKKSGIFEVVVVVAIATLTYEIIVNLGTIAFLPIGFFKVFFFALPFTLIHLVSNIVFALGIKKTKEIIEKKGGFENKHRFKSLFDVIKRGAKCKSGE